MSEDHRKGVVEVDVATMVEVDLGTVVEVEVATAGAAEALLTVGLTDGTLIRMGNSDGTKMASGLTIQHSELNTHVDSDTGWEERRNLGARRVIFMGSLWMDLRDMISSLYFFHSVFPQSGQAAGSGFLPGSTSVWA
jgi:hypothetical protein